MLREDRQAERDGACSGGITEATVTGVSKSAVSRRKRISAEWSHDHSNLYGRQVRDDQNADGAQPEALECGGAEEETALRGLQSATFMYIRWTPP